MEAIVLSRHPKGEGDEFVHLLTHDRGSVTLIMRGTKKILSKNSPFLEPGTFIDVDIVPGREVSYGGSVSLLNEFVRVRQDGEKLILLARATALLGRHLKGEDGDPRYFKTLYGFLHSLDIEDRVPPLFWERFVFSLLAIAGTIPELDHCVDGLEKEVYGFSISDGGIVSREMYDLRRREQKQVSPLSFIEVELFRWVLDPRHEMPAHTVENEKKIRDIAEAFLAYHA